MSSKSNRILSGFSWLLFIILCSAILTHLLYLSSTDAPETPKLRYMHKIFLKNPYSHIVNELQETQYGIVKTPSNEFIEKSLEFLSISMKKPLVMRDYQTSNSLVSVVFRSLNSLNSYIAHFLEEKKSNIYVFYVSKLIPEHNIKLIQLYEPDSHIYLIIDAKSKLKVKGFQNVKGTENINLNDNRNLLNLLHFAKIPENISKTYVQFYNNSLSRIFEGLNKNSKDLSLFLGEFEVSVEGLSQKASKIVEELCKKGEISSKKNLKVLQDEEIINELFDIGIAYEGLVYWENDLFRLNYIAATQSNCVQVEIPLSPLFSLEGHSERQRNEVHQNEEATCQCKCENEVDDAETEVLEESYDRVSNKSIEENEEEREEGEDIVVSDEKHEMNEEIESVEVENRDGEENEIEIEQEEPLQSEAEVRENEENGNLDIETIENEEGIEAERNEDEGLKEEGQNIDHDSNNQQEVEL